MAKVLPDPEEFAGLVPGRDSPVWGYASDIRLGSAAGYALLLQVAHPTVGAGVAEFSTFQQDPWGRLFRTLDFVNGTIYGGPEMAGDIGRRVREMHRDIKGVRPDGERYHAMEPDAYAWVHATLAASMIYGHDHLGRGIPEPERERFYADWVRLGRLFGVRARDLPEDWASFEAYFDRMVREELVDNEAVHLVLDTLTTPARPFRAMPRRLSKVLRWAPGQVATVLTVGLLAPELRRTLGLPFGPGRRAAFAVLTALSRATAPIPFKWMRVSGPNYVKLRRKALERGDVAKPPP
jgi:uncharacterized protein (DUF2236 family)